MSILSTFVFESYEIRFVNDKPVANDVAMALGYAYPQQTITKKVSAKNKAQADLATPGGVQPIMVLEEAGVYQLIFGSNMPNAEKFQYWVFEEVLPSIRKTGKYELSQHKPQTAIELVQQQLAALTTLVQISVEHEERLSTIEQENIVLKAELAVQAQINAEQETHLNGLDAELARHQNSEGHFYTVIGFANLNNLQMRSNQAKGLGLRCKKHKIEKEMVSDTMWGEVGSYPVHVLETIFKSQNLI